MAEPATFASLAAVFANVVRAILAMAGITLFILLVIGGFKFITSGGDPKAIEGARNTLTYAILGLVVLLLSYVILVLIKTITGVDVTQFNIVLPQ